MAFACSHAKQPNIVDDVIACADRTIAREHPRNLTAIEARLALGHFDSLHAAIDASAKYGESAEDDAIIATAYARIGDLTAARRYAEHAAASPLDPQARCALADAWQTIGDEHRADAMLGRDAHFRCFGAVARSAARAGHHERAMALAARSDPYDPDAHAENLELVADAYIAAKDTAHARVALAELQRVQTDPATWGYRLSTRFAAIGDVAVAALAMRPTLDAAARDEFLSERATEVIAGTAAAGLKPELATLLARAVALSRDEEVIARELVADVVARYGDAARAHELVRELEALPPGDPADPVPPHYNLLDAYLSFGDLAAALHATDADAVRAEGFSEVAAYCQAHRCLPTPGIQAILAK
jgi:tetratricopeptide (TPR) repeat protein